MLNYSINSLAASPTAPNLDTATPSRQADSKAVEQRNTDGQAAQGKSASHRPRDTRRNPGGNTSAYVAAGEKTRIRFAFSCIQVYNISMAKIRRAKTPIPPFESARKRGDRLFDRLRDDILCGRMLPGEALSETRLAEHHGISRTPVREVIQRLAKEDLLAIVPQIGTFVAPIKLASVTNSQFIREAIECRAVRFATERATRPQVETLRQQVSRQKNAIEKGNPSAFFQLDEQMHSLILDIAGHPHAWDLIASVKAQLDRVRHLSLEDKSWPRMMYRQHVEIVGAIRDKDPIGAEQAMQAHLRTVFDAVKRIAQEHAQFFEQEPPGLSRGIA